MRTDPKRTPQECAEEEFKQEKAFIDQILNTLDDVFFVFTAAGDIVRWNCRAVEVTGYSDEEIARMHPVEFVPPEEADLIRAQIGKVLEEGRTRFEAHFLTKAGQAIPYEFKGSLLTHQDQKLICGIGRDIIERRQLQTQLLQIQEEERRRIGQELHDGIASQLTGLVMMTQSIVRDVCEGKQADASQLEEISEMIKKSVRQIRLLSHGLNPVNVGNDGLPIALEKLASITESHTDMACSLETNGLLPQLDEEVATHLYRIAQEAASNAVRHAGATHIRMRLQSEKKYVILSIQDNGKGLPDGEQQAHGIGLHTMRYRANVIGGHLELADVPGGGTLVRCLLGRSTAN